jgi:hypothetical protein
VGRPGLDPGTLRVFRDCSGVSLSVQICWPIEVACPPTSTEVLSNVNSWLDNWLDLRSSQGLVTIQFRGADGEVFDLQLAEGLEGDCTIARHAVYVSSRMFTGVHSH